MSQENQLLQRRIHGRCPLCARNISTDHTGIIGRGHNHPITGAFCNANHQIIIPFANVANQIDPVPVVNQDALQHANVLVPNVNDENINPNFNIAPVNLENAPINGPMDQAEIPMTYPNIFYNQRDKHAVINWANRMTMYLNQLEEAYRRNEDLEVNRIIETLFKYQHPKSKSESVEPNLNEHDEDQEQQGQHGFRPDEVYPIIHSDMKTVVFRAIRYGNISKARRAMSSDGVGDITKKSIREKIAIKYPTAPEQELIIPLPVQAECNLDYDDEDIQQAFRKYIFSFKRDQSASAYGWKMDFWQDLLFYKPDCLNGLLIYSKLILNDKLSGEMRRLVLLGRGIPLNQSTPTGGVKIRPININDPLDKVSAHLLGWKNQGRVKELCGKYQLGNCIQGGVEILIWTVKILLELNPSWVLFSSDCENAFNSGYKRKIMERVNDKIPEISTYAYTLLKESLQVDYTNFNEKKCMRVQMDRGVPQGNPISGSIFNIFRSDELEELRQENDRVIILSFHDDDYFLGEPNDVFPAVLSLDNKMQPLGIMRNQAKCKVYDPNGVHEQLQQQCNAFGCVYVPSEEGIIVCGAPVGSLRFQREYVLAKVDQKVKREIDQLKQVMLTPNGELKKENQCIYQIIRLCVPSQLTFLFRTCTPDVTEDAAKRLDELITEFLIILFNARPYFQEMNQDEKKIFVKRIQLQFSKGGLGITPSEAIVGAAFVGSITLTFQYISSLIPDLKERWPENNSRSFILFTQHLEIAKRLCPSLQEITLATMENKIFEAVQKEIANGIQKEMEEEVDRSVPDGRPAGGAEMMYAHLTPWEQERTIQHMANKDPINYAFLIANPCAKLCSMSNSSLTLAVQHRLMLPIGRNFRFCKCGEDVGPFFSHCYRCKVGTVRNQVRNSLHKDIKEKYSDIIKTRITTSNLEHRVLNEEPRLEDYFGRINPLPEQPNQNQNQNYFESSQFDRRGFENNVKVRADLSVQNSLNPHKNLVIDFTFVEPTAKSYVGTYNRAGQAALKGKENKIRNEYKHWNVSSNNEVTNIFKVIAVETFGVVIKEDII